MASTIKDQIRRPLLLQRYPERFSNGDFSILSRRAPYPEYLCSRCRLKTYSTKPIERNPASNRSRDTRSASRENLAQRDFFFDILNVNATRRDAKQYLSRFKSREQRKGHEDALKHRPASVTTANSPGVNLGSLYAPTRAIEESPQFQQNPVASISGVNSHHEAMHLALVTLRGLDLIDDWTLDGVAHTLSQLVRLDMQLIIAFEPSLSHDLKAGSTSVRKAAYQQQAERLIRAINSRHGPGAKYIDSAFATEQALRQAFRSPSRLASPTTFLSMPDLLLRALGRGCILVIPPLAFTPTCRALEVDRCDILLALTRAMVGLRTSSNSDRMPDNISLDRIIMIDPQGGIPSFQRRDGAHVFVNLEQEYQDIRDEISETSLIDRQAVEQHIANLTDLQQCLALLPPTSSALVLSPEEAASSSRPQSGDVDVASIRTRRQKNPLIHNLLTNRPVISSSLPTARLSLPDTTSRPNTQQPSRSTLVKKGMPLTIVPDPRDQHWTPPPSGKTSLTLDDHPEINFSRLLALIEDSFRRPLDVRNYLDRIRGRIAGVIIAGEYGGGAILTWESPPGSSGDPARLVPYLDKFAVLQKAQGNAGVADIVFQAMVRSCFPNGVCWRSRSDNPVNKWYFERSAGSWKLPGGQWTAFWTTPSDELVPDQRRWSDYVAVCQGVVPSWADGKKAD